MNFDDNALEDQILQLRDLNEEEPAEIENSKYDLAYIKLNGSIKSGKWSRFSHGKMDIIKLHGQEPANLDVGGEHQKKVTAHLNLFLQIKMKGIQ